MRYDEYRAHDGLGLAALVAAKEVTAAELLDVAQARAAEVAPKLGSVIVRDMDAQARGRLEEPLDGPYAGVPFVIKDLAQDYAGLPTSSGCRALAALPMPEHATVVQRWLDAGLVVFGKTNTPEFGAKGITEPDLFGPARNPWDPSRTPGGSSGGSAAAVAAGIVPVAGASDGGGSIRIPAGCCGLFGLKPGRGIVPSGPRTGETLHGSVTQGVLSRSVRDTAAMLDVIAGTDAVAPFHAAGPDATYAALATADPGQLRIGFVSASALTPDPHPEAVAAVEGAARLLESLGHEVEPVASPVDDRAVARDFLTTWFVHCALTVAEVRRVTGCGDEGFEEDTLLMAALGRAVSGVEHERAIERRHEHVRALAAFHGRYDLLLTPTLAQPPVKVGALDTPLLARLGAKVLLKTRTTGVLPHLGVVEQVIDANLGWVPFTQLANLTGRPAASLPLHWTADGVPLGVQVVGRLGSEGTLLALATQLEAAQPWAERQPVL
ncbi:amidase [Paraconexibacter antarcticus]|uniref:Amidase n=1 Tax=Paraconexibacter antarcticus TaxID=2949664 RepID=A0ABY5DUE3_9ACTN|nr:amidase [Paraconexibacter antarcticus]UTI65110.1 amidase [Paraconexibacter antarcticus]